MKKRLIAFLLVLIMVLGMLPVSAFAVDGDAIEYTVTYYKNDGSENDLFYKTDDWGRPSEQFNIYWEKPTRDGYDFVGWAETRDATEAKYASGGAGGKQSWIKLDGPKVLYAVWQEAGLEPEAPRSPSDCKDQLKTNTIKLVCVDGNHPDKVITFADISYGSDWGMGDTCRLNFYAKDAALKYPEHAPKNPEERIYVTFKWVNNETDANSKYLPGKWVMDETTAAVVELVDTGVEAPSQPTTAQLGNIKVTCRTNAEHSSEFPVANCMGTTVGTVTFDSVKKQWYIDTAPMTTQLASRYDSWKGYAEDTHRLVNPDAKLNARFYYDDGKWYTEDTLAIDVCCGAVPEIPDKPTTLDGSFAIVCKNNEATHAHKADYIATPSQYTISDVQKDEQGYYVTATVTVAPNLVAYNTLTGAEHRLVDEQDATLTITFRYDTEVTGDENRKWKQQGEVPVVEVICAEIEEPTREDIFKALNGLVTVTCINRFWKDGNKNMDCGQGQYAAKAGIAGQEYTLEKGENAGTWVVTFPVTNFVNAFKQDPAHNLYTKDTLRWYIRWENNAWTSAPVEPGVDDLVKLTHAPTDWREVAKIATGGKDDCIHTICKNSGMNVCDYGITVPFVNFNEDVVSVKPEAGVPGSYIATFKVDKFVDARAKVCNDTNFPNAPRTHKLLTQDTVQWRLYATSEADEKIGNNVLNHVWEAEPVTPGTDDVCTIAHNWVVTFNPDNGGDTFKQNVEYEDKATEPTPAPEKEGYAFTGWYLDEAEEPFNFGTTITSDITLTAHWTIMTVDVSFDPNGGSVDPTSKTVKIGEAYGELPVPTRKGYNFAGWYTEAEDGTVVTADTTVTATTDHTLYAHWTLIPPSADSKPSYSGVNVRVKCVDNKSEHKQGAYFYGLVYGLSDYSGINEPESWVEEDGEYFYTLTINKDVYIARYANTTKTAHTEVGENKTEVKWQWNGTKWVLLNEKDDKGIVLTINVKCEEKQTVQVVIYRNGDTEKAYQTVALEKMPKGTVIDLTKLNIADYYTANYTGKYDFYGWFNDGAWNEYKKNPERAGLDSITVNGWTNIICMVYDYENVVYYMSDADRVADNRLFATTARKGAALPTADAPTATRDGYTFTFWSREGQLGTDVTNQTVNGWTNLVANWKANTYTVTFDANGGSVDPTSKTVTFDEPYGELPVPTRTGYDFLGWFTAAEDGDQVTANTTVTATADHTLYAQWQKKTFTVKYYLPDETGAWVEKNMETVDSVDYATHSLWTPDAKNGYKFSGWYQKADDIGVKAKVEQLYMAKEWKLYGKFTPIEYTIQYVYNDGKATSTNPTTYTVESDTITLADATGADWGKTFLEWHDENGQKITEIPTGSTGDRVITAYWNWPVHLHYLDKDNNEIESATLYVSELKPGACVLPTGEKTGYDFDGWYEAKKDIGTASHKLNALSIAKKWELYGRYTAKTDVSYTVKYLREGDNKVLAPEKVVIDQAFDTEVTEQAADVVGYTPDAPSKTMILDEYNKVLTFSYSAKTYRYEIHYFLQEPDGSYMEKEVDTTPTGLFDTTVTITPDPNRYGAHYSYNSVKSVVSGVVTVDDPATILKLNVYYDLDFHTLTFDTMGGSKVAPETVRHGLTVAKPKDPVKGGYIFYGWYTDKTFSNRYNFATPLTEDITIYSKWVCIALPGTTVNWIVLPGTTVKKNTPELNTPTLNTADHFAYVQGYPDGTVKPTGDVTRAEVATILYRVMDADCVKTYETTRCSFSDVVRGDWFNLYVATLENAGVIVDTRTNGKFRPNEAITRAELAAMLAQFADIKSATNSFNDVSARHWASDEIAVCAKMGWINGYPDGSFRPDATITRAEMMAMINRALDRTPKSVSDLLSGMKTWSDNANVNAWYYLDVQEATNSHTYTKSGSHETWKKLR